MEIVNTNGIYKMAKFDKKQQYTPPVQQKIFQFLLDKLKYPKKIFDKYKVYNAAVSEILIETQNPSLHDLRVKNAKLVNFFILLPIFLGFVIMTVNIFTHRTDFIYYYFKATSSFGNVGYFQLIIDIIKRLYYIIFSFPFGLKIIKWLFYGYGLSICGAFILSLNPAFKEEDKISHIFATLGYIDAEGHPWKVTWTPEAIMITSFNCDAIALSQNTRFWSSINFPPSSPKILKKDMKKFIVMRKYELPQELVFVLKEKD
jgi:hypothetical protein